MDVLLEAREQLGHRGDRGAQRPVALLALAPGHLGELADGLLHHDLGLGREGLAEPRELVVEARLLACDRVVCGAHLLGEPGALLAELACLGLEHRELVAGAVELEVDPLGDGELRVLARDAPLQDAVGDRGPHEQPCDRADAAVQRP